MTNPGSRYCNWSNIQNQRRRLQENKYKFSDEIQPLNGDCNMLDILTFTAQNLYE